VIIATYDGASQPPGCEVYATELGSRSVLRVPRARVVPLSAPPSSYIAAVERYLTGAGIAKSSARIYRISLTT
jgi:integrase/recombinase XerD